MAEPKSLEELLEEWEQAAKLRDGERNRASDEMARRLRKLAERHKRASATGCECGAGHPCPDTEILEGRDGD